jgi:ferritin-like metal-binding protein YciE
MCSPNVYGSRLACRARALRDVVLPNTFHQESKMTQRKTVDDLFVHMLSDIYSAEKQLTKALAKLSRAASDPELSEAFKTHLE